MLGIRRPHPRERCHDDSVGQIETPHTNRFEQRLAVLVLYETSCDISRALRAYSMWKSMVRKSIDTSSGSSIFRVASS